MTFKKDYNELLLYLLRELVKNALHFEEIVSGSISGLAHIDVKVEELQSKVKLSQNQLFSFSYEAAVGYMIMMDPFWHWLHFL